MQYLKKFEMFKINESNWIDDIIHSFKFNNDVYKDIIRDLMDLGFTMNGNPYFSFWDRNFNRLSRKVDTKSSDFYYGAQIRLVASFDIGDLNNILDEIKSCINQLRANYMFGGFNMNVKSANTRKNDGEIVIGFIICDKSLPIGEVAIDNPKKNIPISLHNKNISMSKIYDILSNPRRTVGIGKIMNFEFEHVDSPYDDDIIIARPITSKYNISDCINILSKMLLNINKLEISTTKNESGEDIIILYKKY